MICSKCSQTIQKGANFCSKCGQSVGEAEVKDVTTKIANLPVPLALANKMLASLGRRQLQPEKRTPPKKTDKDVYLATLQAEAEDRLMADDIVETFKICSHAIAQNPPHGEFHLIMGDALQRAHRYIEAINVYDQAIKLGGSRFAIYNVEAYLIMQKWHAACNTKGRLYETERSLLMYDAEIRDKHVADYTTYENENEVLCFRDRFEKLAYLRDNPKK